MIVQIVVVLQKRHKSPKVLLTNWNIKYRQIILFVNKLFLKSKQKEMDLTVCLLPT